MSYRERALVEKIFGVLFLPITWPGILVILLAEYLCDRILKIRRPELLIGVIAMAVIVLYCIALNRYF